MALGSRSLSDLVEQVRQRSDMEHSEFVSDSEIATYVQASWGELYDLIISECGPQHFVAFDVYTQGTDDPAVDYYKVIEVNVKDEGRWIPVQPRNFPGLDRGDGKVAHSLRAVEYTVTSDASRVRSITFLPSLPDGTEVMVTYVPLPWSIDNTASGVLQGFSGWEEYVVCDAAAKCLEKEESNAQHLYMRTAKAQERVLHHARTMNYDSGGRVRNIDAERRKRWWEVL